MVRGHAELEVQEGTPEADARRFWVATAKTKSVDIN